MIENEEKIENQSSQMLTILKNQEKRMWKLNCNPHSSHKQGTLNYFLF